ncbi:hypothetical protein [Flindersiella endophytica]
MSAAVSGASPETFLQEADRLLGEGSGPPVVWPRACVWLTRLALESALDELWKARLPQARGAPMRAQLLLLPDFVGTDVAEQARRAWLSLSRVAHHHSFELAPTVVELRAWHSDVTSAVAALQAAAKSS